jgi:hypothetical protein
MSRIAAAYGASAPLFCYRRSDRQLPDTAANLGAQAQPDIVVSNSSGESIVASFVLSFWSGETWYSCEFFDFTADRYFLEGGVFLKFSHPSPTF